MSDDSSLSDDWPGKGTRPDTAYRILESLCDEWDEYTDAGHRGKVEQAMRVLEDEESVNS